MWNTRAVFDVKLGQIMKSSIADTENHSIDKKYVSESGPVNDLLTRFA